MSESSVLSQNEVDALLKGISGGEFEVYDGPIERVKQQFNRWGMAKLTKFLRDPFGVKKREYDAQRRKRVAQRREFDAQWTFNWKVPSSFNQNIPVVSFFNGGDNAENVLADIHAKNEAQGSGNIKIPGTDIELINYSQCPKCERVFSHQEVQDYYANPKPVEGVDRSAQYRGDTRMHCAQCDTYFYHSLVISDGYPVNETWYLCRAQTVDAVEWFYHQKGEKVLTRVRGNRIQGEDGKIGILNDLDLGTLSEQPDLVTSVLQYTPPKYIMAFVEGKNLENRDLLFGAWM